MIAAQVFAIARRNQQGGLGLSHAMAPDPPTQHGPHIYVRARCGQRIYSDHEVFAAYPSQIGCERCRQALTVEDHTLLSLA